MKTKLLCAACGGLLLSASAFGQDLSITSVQTVDTALHPYQPVLGDANYRLMVTFHSTGWTATSFTIRFEIADQVLELTSNPVSVGDYTWYAFAFCPLEGPISYRVTLDPYNRVGDPNRTNNVATGTFAPLPPLNPIDYFAPRRIASSANVSLALQNGTVTKLEMWLGKPATDTFQRVFASTPSSGFETVTSPFSAPAFVWDVANPSVAGGTLTERNTTQAASVRVNSNLLRNVSWAAESTVPAEAAPYLIAESTIEKNDPAIADFAARNLPADYQATLGPYDAARSLFLGVVKECAYERPGASYDALSVLANHAGDAEGLSRLLVAALRNIGVPARIVEGFADNSVQVQDGPFLTWVEFYLTGAGWVSADVASCALMSPDGNVPYFFGVLPDLNTRVAVSRAATHTYAGYTSTTLEGGAAFYSGTAGVKSYTSQASAQESPDGLQPGFLGQDSQNGIGLWRTRGGSVTSWTPLGSPGAGWEIRGVGDFDGDGQSDMIGQNSTTGEVALWFMSGDRVTSYRNLGSPGANWKVVGVGDFDRDGHADFLGQNGVTHDVAIWYLNGPSVVKWQPVGNPNATIQGVGDFNGDGGVDMLGRYANGSLAIWFMNDNRVIGWTQLGDPGSDVTVRGVADFDNDGKADILGQYASNRNLAIWYTDGYYVTNWQVLGDPGLSTIRAAGILTR